MNPFTAKRNFVTRHGEPLADNFRFKGHQSRAIAASGEINASNKRDLMKQIDKLITAYSQGDIQKETSSQEVIEARRQALAEAFQDKSGAQFKVLGEVLADEIYETMNREGFSRRVCQFKELGQGEVGRIRVRKKDAKAWLLTSASTVVPSVVRTHYIYPPEFYINAHILIEERDIAQSTGDILEEKYTDGLEQLMVVEDRAWLKAANPASTTSNDLRYFSTLTPEVFSMIRTQVARWGIPVTTVIIAHDIWDDILGDQDFMAFFDPISKHELVLSGSLGSLMGADLITDAFRLPELKVLDPGQIFAVGAPQTHGTIMQRGDLGSHPVDSYNVGEPKRGWFLSEMISLTIANSKSIARGQRS